MTPAPTHGLTRRPACTSALCAAWSRALEAERDRISELHAESQSEIDRLRADAARYRWLRGDAPPHSERWPRWSIEYWNGAAWCQMKGEELDARIDTALAQEGER